MKTALITGANRGIGLEFASQLKARGYNVIGCCRQPQDASELKTIADHVIQLDVSNDHDLDALKRHLLDKPIDLLVNNAGITGEQGVTIGHINRDNFLHVLDVNCVGALKVNDALLANIRASRDKSILVISSSMGSIADNYRGRSYAYRASKAALNCVMRSFAIDAEAFGVKVMLINPGWVKTNIGGDNATLTALESVSSMLKQFDLHIEHSHADRVRNVDGQTIPW